MIAAFRYSDKSRGPLAQFHIFVFIVFDQHTIYQEMECDTATQMQDKNKQSR